MSSAKWRPSCLGLNVLSKKLPVKFSSSECLQECFDNLKYYIFIITEIIPMQEMWKIHDLISQPPMEAEISDSCIIQ